MKLKKFVHYQCSALVQPGEYTIDRWDNQQCNETNPRWLAKCEECEQLFCINLHWRKHFVDEC